jgi:uncharacterized protein (DUF1015 family)
MRTSGSPALGLRLAPFRGLRYVPERVGSLAAVTSPPYDVVVRPDGQLHLAASDPYNVVRLILPPASHQAAWTLCQWQQEGILAPDPEPALYVYEQRDGDLLQRGLIGALRLTPPAEGVVLPHEDVMPGPVAERAALMRATAANLEPLLLVYQGGTTAAAVVERTAGREPLLATTTEDGVRHRLWHVIDPDEIAAVNADLSTHQALIADGHHRWATYLQLQGEQAAPSPWDYGLVLLVDTARYPLRVRAIHRVLPKLPVADAIAAVRGIFRVQELPGRHLPDALAALEAASAEGNAFLLAGDGGFHLLDQPDPHRVDQSVPHDRPEAWRRLDATVLHSLLLDDVWKVPDAPEHITYIHNAEAAVEQAGRHAGTAVLLYPVRETVVRELAVQGITMPRKSTSFGPKPATGLVMRSLDLD